MVLRYKDIHAFDSYKKMVIIYSMYRAGEVSVHWSCCEGATQPYPPGALGGGGGGAIIQAQDQQVLPHVVRQW